MCVSNHSRPRRTIHFTSFQSKVLMINITFHFPLPFSAASGQFFFVPSRQGLAGQPNNGNLRLELTGKFSESFSERPVHLIFGSGAKITCLRGQHGWRNKPCARRCDGSGAGLPVGVCYAVLQQYDVREQNAFNSELLVDEERVLRFTNPVPAWRIRGSPDGG